MITEEDIRNEKYFYIRELTPEVLERYEIARRFLPPYPDLVVPIPEGIEDDIYEIWRTILEDHQTDNEWRYTYQCEEEIKENQDVWDDSIADLRRARSNSETWIEDAHNEFQKQMDFIGFKIASKDVYSKHYGNVKWADKKVKNVSSNRAILGKVLTDDQLLEIYQRIVLQNFDFFQDNRDSDDNTDFEFAVDVSCNTGYSKGVACSKLLFKVSRTTALFHPYPITDSEAQKKEILAYSE